MILIKKIYKIIPIFCVVILALSLILPHDLFWNTSHMTPLGYSTLIICPIVSIVGMIVAAKNRKWAYFFLNLLFFFSFPLMMLLGTIVNVLYAMK